MLQEVWSTHKSLGNAHGIQAYLLQGSDKSQQWKLLKYLMKTPWSWPILKYLELFTVLVWWLLWKESYGVLKVGIIRIISFKGGRVTFGCSKFTAMQSRNNFYVSTENLSSFEFISYDALEDYYPLQRIGDLNMFKFSLHHYISFGSF